MTARTSSESQSDWQARIIQSRNAVEVIVGEKRLPPVRCPSIDELEQRHKAADQSWLDDWLKDETDPTRRD